MTDKGVSALKKKDTLNPVLVILCFFFVLGGAAIPDEPNYYGFSVGATSALIFQLAALICIFRVLSRRVLPKGTPLTQEAKQRIRLDIAAVTIALLLNWAFSEAGRTAAAGFGEHSAVLKLLHGAALLMAVLLPILQVLPRKHQTLPSGELWRLSVLRDITNLYAAVLVLLGELTALGDGYLYAHTDSFSLFRLCASTTLICAGLMQIQIPVRPELKWQIDKKNCPLLYETAETAARKLDCRGKIELAVGPFQSIVSIRMIGRHHYRIYIDVRMLRILNRKEFEAAFLHEFGHAAGGNAQLGCERVYYGFLTDNINLGPVSTVLRHFFIAAWISGIWQNTIPWAAPNKRKQVPTGVCSLSARRQPACS